MKKTFRLIIFFQVVSTFAWAQTSPNWKGFLVFNQGKDSSAFEVSFHEFIDSTGQSFSARNTSEEIISNLQISYHQDTISISEEKVIKAPARITDFLLMKLVGTVQSIEGQCIYTGSFDAFFNGDPNRKSLSGVFSLQKDIPCLTPVQTEAVPPELPDWQMYDTDYGKVVYLKKSRAYQLNISDVEKIDGERITISKNDQILHDNMRLGSDAVRVQADLAEEEFIEVWATGFGVEPPLTLRFELESEGELLFDHRIDLQINQRIKFVVRKE